MSRGRRLLATDRRLAGRSRQVIAFVNGDAAQPKRNCRDERVAMRSWIEVM
jgi:hypothetical protein